MTRKELIAKTIFDWLNHTYAKDETPPRDKAPYSFNENEEDLTIGVDGYLNCNSLAEVIDKKLV